MKAEFKRLTVQFSHELKNKMADLLIKAFENKEESTSDIINLIMSAHISSMFSLMRAISSEHEKINEKVLDFIEKMNEFIRSQKLTAEVIK